MTINKSGIKRYLLISLPLTLMWILVFFYFNYSEKMSLLHTITTEELSNNKSTDFIIADNMRVLKEELYVIRDSIELQSYLKDRTTDNKRAVEDLFIRLLKNKTEYDQLRIINTEGMEIIRTRNSHSGPTIENKLQNKSKRYYFQKALNSDQENIYISSLDLNIEDEKIEPQLNPMLRFAIALFSPDGTKRGILIINYKADRFINLLSNHSEIPLKNNVQSYVMNQKGQFINHPENKLDFSFMFEQFKDIKIADKYPSFWKEVQNKTSGIYSDKNNYFIYYDVLSETKKQNPQYKEKWLILQTIEKVDIFGFNTFIGDLFSAANILLFFIVQVFILLSSILYEKLRLHAYQLKITQQIAETTNDAVIITDPQTVITHVNKAYEEATGYSRDEVLGHKPSEFKSGQHNNEFYRSMWHSIKKTDTWGGTIWDKKKNGLLYPKKLRILSIREKKGGPVDNYIGIFKVLSTNDKKLKSVEATADDSPGLKLANEEMLVQLLDSNIKDKSFRFMVICITIENFNELISLNAAYDPGSISAIFIDLLKPLIHEEDFIAQTSRNMYSVIINLKHIQIPYDNYISGLYEAISQIVKNENSELFFKTRMGVSFWPNDADDIRRLLLNSIIALEWTMNRQSREYAFYSPEMIETISKENKIERLLKKALPHKELYLAYQPQVEAETGRPLGAEALLRWNNSEMGEIFPSQFVPIAERSNMIIEIGYWIFERVCQDLRILVDRKAAIPGQFKIAVNLSAMQLEDPSFPGKVLSIIDSYSLDHRLLELEITESLLLSNQETNNRILESFRSKDFSIALDDFGTGYSSLSYLHKLPVDKMKIDRSFIKDYPETDDGKMATILISMSKTLGIKVLTEGVENKEQLAFIKENGCNIIQGFYFSKPLTFGDFSDFLEK